MTKIEYTCRKCAKTVTIEQYKKDSFCPNCGTKLNQKPLPKHWLFQFNPTTYKWSIRTKETNQPEQWLVSQNSKLMKKGDLVAIWGAGHKGGIFALGKIMTNPTKNPLNDNQTSYFSSPAESAKFNEKTSAYVEYFKLSIEKPLLTQEICSKDKILADLQVFMNHQGTNFRLRHEQWERIKELIEN